MKITENNIKYMVNESIKKLLKEYAHTSSGIFSSYPELERLETIINNFTRRTIEVSDDNEVTNWDEFIDGINIIISYCEAKEILDRNNVRERYAQIGWNGEFDDWVYDMLGRQLYAEIDSNFEAYLNNSELWNTLPDVNTIMELAGELSKFIEMYYRNLIQMKTSEYNSDCRYFLNKISKL